jgi:anti-sigma-K factor RskA
MSDAFQPHEERDLRAAEYVLGLLEGEALMAARGQIATDPDFADAVAAWERRLAPMFDGIEEVPPPAELWGRIEQALGAEGNQALDNIIRLRKRERMWKGYAGAMTALAAGLALFLALQVAQPDALVPQPQQPVAEAPALVAALASEEGDASLAVTISADRRTLVVTPTRIATVSNHSHELWLLPASGTPVSLGVITPGVPKRHSIPANFAGEIHAETALAISVEPKGGSPTGLPTGPVIASAPLRQI